MALANWQRNLNYYEAISERLPWHWSEAVSTVLIYRGIKSLTCYRHISCVSETPSMFLVRFNQTCLICYRSVPNRVQSPNRYDFFIFVCLILPSRHASACFFGATAVRVRLSHVSFSGWRTRAIFTMARPNQAWYAHEVHQKRYHSYWPCYRSLIRSVTWYRKISGQ